ncbi:thioredoxin-like protein [Gonapodya prolifera JEL478]|uniref:Thioredoxin n=1 Tax=Gonapodya prolifera (strain JEL478) TaxID=1344416 RepID=A0A139A9S2_GONPJ|nr:thioredoxin-like protein [Gonapodya prolifera JEL478]|eukprot:KXS13225.1 thioredoxin-like protein [Gonapodya prolifera JEL478]
MVKVLSTKKEWDELYDSGAKIAVDFFAEWCGPCKFISPYFAELSEKYPDITFVKIDVDSDELGPVAEELGISAMPTFKVFHKKKQVSELVGASKDKLKDLVDSLHSHE